MKMTREGIIFADVAQLNDWIDEHVMDDFDEGDSLLPGWATDMSAAWEVVSKFPMFEVTRIEYFEGNITHEAKVWIDLEEGTVPHEISAKTAPEAICKAALIAVMGGE